MSQPASNQGETSKLRKLLGGNVDQDSVTARLPRANRPNNPGVPPPPNPPASASPSAEDGSKPTRYKFLHAFWTFASVLSLVVNVILIAILLAALQMLGTIQLTANDQVSGLLGGLYTNFVKMDEARIIKDIDINERIPVQFTLNVSGPTNVTLSQDVTINGALVTVETGGLNIVNARATIVLPRDTILPINIQNLVVPVDQQVPVVLKVPVNIPLNETELHDPFVGLQKVVKPFYCLVEPNAIVNNVRICSPVSTQP
jgi:hypothetical protein